MTTKASGGKITGLLALTMEAQVALTTGQWVHVTGDYAVNLADGSRPVLGHVSVANTRRESDPNYTRYPVSEVPGDVTVEARGLYVKETAAAGVIAAGAWVVVAADNRVRAYDPTAAPGAADTADEIIGIALTGAAAAGDLIDVLVR